MSTLEKFFADEKAHNAILSAGYGKEATADAKAARVAAQEARAAELGETSSKAKTGVKLLSPNGELQMSVTKNEVADARSIMEGKPLVWEKDNKREGRDVKAGDAREPSITSKFLAENAGQLVNNQTNLSGLDAINFKAGGQYAVAYMKVEGIKADYETIRDVTNHTRGTTCAIDIRRNEVKKESGKSKGGAEMGA